MKPPEEVFPQRKAAEFDETGRPHHSFFYTSKPNFFEFLHNIVANTLECNKFEDRMVRQLKTPDPVLQLDLSGSQWLSKEQVELRMVETIRDVEYDSFVNAMNRLANHPYSYRVKDFINDYRRPLMNQTITLEIPKPEVDTDGRSFITVYGELFCLNLLSLRHHDYHLININLYYIAECLRKRARGDVTLRFPGTGKISINGQPITYFEHDQPREQVSFWIKKR